MSPDDILAANLWPWPDPLLKRDPAGNVLFVNAAFLQLYGGRVEDWYGQPVAGWPVPSAHGAQRFETRAGDIGNEVVYDWVEMVMADSHAIAIARNVTALIAPPTPPAEQAPVPEASQIDIPPITSSQPAPLPASDAPLPQTPPLAPPAPEPTVPAPAMEAPRAPEPAPIAEPAPAANPAQDLSLEFEQTLNNGADDYAYAAPTDQPLTPAEPAPAPQTEAPAPEPMPPAPAYSPAPEPAPEERMIERRALPIEDSTAVLGSNWRDQVIAKAIGGVSGDEGAEEQALGAAAPQEEAQEVDGKKPGEGLHILLAEDNAINALLTRTLLEADGATVETVEDGALAVQAVQNKHYDLIFMDMRMPNMDGLEATRKIRSFGEHHAKVPIVALTANAFDDDRNACFDSGMNDFMTKPVSAEELSEMVINWTKDSNETEEKLAS